MSTLQAEKPVNAVNQRKRKFVSLNNKLQNSMNKKRRLNNENNEIDDDSDSDFDPYELFINKNKLIFNL